MAVQPDVLKEIKVGDYFQIKNVDRIVGGDNHWNDGDVVKILEINQHKFSPSTIEYFLERTKNDFSIVKNVITADELKYVDYIPANNGELFKLNTKVGTIMDALVELKAMINNRQFVEPFVTAQDFDCEDVTSIVEDIPELDVEVKTNNELRKELIEEAKVFVELDQHRNGNGIFILESSTGEYLWHITVVNFKYCYKKRTVALRIYDHDGDIIDRHVVTCHPNDTFNLHLGKAIALGRALGLDVSKFENAPAPDGFVVGQYVGTKDIELLLAPFKVDKVNYDEVYDELGFYNLAENLKILGDTHAQY